MNKKILEIIVIALVVASMLNLSVKTARATGDFPIDAGGPYMGIAEVRPGGKVLPIYFHGTYGPLPGPSMKVYEGWNFGDSSSGSGSNPVHEYENPGDYTATFYVNAPPYYAEDDASVEIFSNDWMMGRDLIANKILVYWNQWITFKMDVASTYGDFDDTPPFEIVMEIWQGPTKLFEIYRQEFEGLAPGENTGYQEKAWRATLDPGWYYCLGKVVFPNGLEYELCTPDDWPFRIWQL
jgi:hypothetical protein